MSRFSLRSLARGGSRFSLLCRRRLTVVLDLPTRADYPRWLVRGGSTELGPAARVRIGGALFLVGPALPYMDRAVLACAVEPLRAELWLTDATLGLVAAVYFLLLALGGPAFMALESRGPRRPRLVAAGLFLAALGTGLAGLAGNFPALLAALGTMGIGLAAGASLAPTLLATKKARSILALAASTATGYALGSLALIRWGWRSAFFMAAGIGLAAALAWLRSSGSPSSQESGAFVPFAPDRIALSARQLLSQRRWLTTLAAFTLLAFAASGLAFWAPAFLVRVRGLSRSMAAGQLAAAVLMAGVAGWVLGETLRERLGARSREADRLTAGLACLISTPLLLVACADPRPILYLPFLVAGASLLFCAVRPAFSAILDAVPVEQGSVAAITLLVVRVGGEAPGPLVLGALADASSLARAIFVVPAAALLAGALFTYAGRRPPEATRGGRER